jgi:hypothetical protein
MEGPVARRRLTIAIAVSAAASLAAAASPLAAHHDDTKRPKTHITSGPAGTTDDPTPTFEFTSNEKHSRFKCRIDGGAAA